MATWYYSSEATGANDGTSEADAWTDFATAVGGLTAGDTLYLKTASDGSRVNLGNFTQVRIVGTIDDNTTIEGYKDTPGDGGPFLAYHGYLTKSDGNSLIMKYLDISNGGGGYPYQTIQDFSGTLFYRCKFESVSSSTYACRLTNGSLAIECTFIGNQSGDNYVVIAYRTGLYNCHILQKSTGRGLQNELSYQNASIIGNVIECTNLSNTSAGIYCSNLHLANNVQILGNNTIRGFGTGIYIPNGIDERYLTNLVMYGNIIYDCAEGIVNAQSTNTNTNNIFPISNAFGNISGSNFTNISENGLIEEIQLTASPFEDTTDFVINDTAGGGALLKGLLGPPDVKGLTATNRVSYPTYGAVVPSPFFEYLDSGSFDGSTGGVGDTLTVSGRSYQLIQDNPRVWRRV